MVLKLKRIHKRACFMRRPSVKVMLLILLSGLFRVAACTSTEAWYKGKPVSQLTPAEREEQDPGFWPMWEHLHGIGK
jgi:hypothetical protein